MRLGTCGVALLVGFDHVSSKPGAGIAIAAVLFASFNYGIASNYAKQAKAVEPFANAHGSMWASALLVLPVVPFFPAPGEPTIGIMSAVDGAGGAVQRRGLPDLLPFDPGRRSFVGTDGDFP